MVFSAIYWHFSLFCEYDGMPDFIHAVILGLVSLATKYILIGKIWMNGFKENGGGKKSSVLLVCDVGIQKTCLQ